MNASKIFTDALVKQQTGHENPEPGYFGRTDYLSEDAWEALIKGMADEHKQQYGGGSGGELEPKGTKPPKMAAYASSSRMMYTLSTQEHDISGIRFEEKLPTTVGGIANMDGYREKNGEFIFVEAKCREPYDHHAEQTVKQVYKGVYRWLRDKMPRVFSCVMEECDNNDMRVVFFCKGEVVAHFDIKQMICHLLGVATKFLQPLDKKGTLWQDFDKIHFLYLLFDPTQLPLSGDKKTAVMEIYHDTCKSAKHYHFEEMFAQTVDYLVSLRNENNKPVPDEAYLNKLKAAFKFTLCSQHDYHTYF